MKRIAIFRHAPTEGPGYLADFLQQQQVPWQLIAIDAGEAAPAAAADWAGLVFMGGPMSVNDDLPWIAPALQLIRDAVRLNIPVLGHCLGGQLMSRALGGEVSRNAVKEIGWGTVELSSDASGSPSPAAARLFAPGTRSFEAFHWHGETFSLPEGATRILQNRWCQNQGFVLGPHIALQCHIEMTAAMVEEWCHCGQEELLQSAHSPAVQQSDVMRFDMQPRLAALQAQANHLYSQWIKGLRHD